ncbi:MAG: hypothetical protein JWQ26_2547 [Modestobacter sp.]|nr:hypothetical protein [Modestobacter sp.]
MLGGGLGDRPPLIGRAGAGTHARRAARPTAGHVRCHAVEALRAPGALERAYTLPAGTLPGPVVVHVRTVETLVHGWDLARATGRGVPFSDELAEQELAFSRELLGRDPQQARHGGRSS